MTNKLNNKLHFGCYTVTLPKMNEMEPETIVCNPLTQSDYMDGWIAVLPRKKAKSTVYNWNVQLSQLPPHLWSRCYVKINTEGKMYYKRIQDGIYLYNVTMTPYDNIMMELYKELNRILPDNTKVQTLYDTIKDNTSGWLLMSAKRFLKQ